MSLSLDARYAVRLIRRNPLVSTIVILTLALCIGANTAIFSVVDATLLRPLPYPEPDRLVLVATHIRSSRAEGENYGQNGKTWEAVRDHATFLDSAIYSSGTEGVNFAAAGNVQYVQRQRQRNGRAGRRRESRICNEVSFEAGTGWQPLGD